MSAIVNKIHLLRDGVLICTRNPRTRTTAKRPAVVTDTPLLVTCGTCRILIARADAAPR